MGQKAGLLILSAWLALMSAHVSALGLGAISLKSNLNQPLSAEIELLELRGLTESEILVGLASQDDFDRVGVDRNYFLTDLKFDVNFTGKNGPTINIRSSKIVREPYLNFVILVRWPSGKLLREYTVLMDLPVFSDEAPTAVSSAQTSKATAPRPAQQPAQPRYNPRASYNETPARNSGQATSNNSGPKYTGNSYEVASDDTLWEIALQVRPDRNISVHQTMLAIQSANPNAFINNNINLLKKGQILRIPERDQMASLNQRQAIMEVKEQVQRWSGNENVSDAPLEASSSYSTQDKASTSVEGRVKLAAPEEAYASEQGRGAGASSNTSSKALDVELSSTLEELDKSSRENNELRSKVQALEEQIKTMERLIEVGNEDLRSMELSAKARAEEVAAAKMAEEAALAEAERLAREAQQEGENTTVANAGVDVVAPEPVEMVTPEPVAMVTPEPVAEVIPVEETKPTEAPKPVEQPKGIVDLIIDNILYIGLGLILLLAVGGFLIQRKMSNSEFDDDDDDDFLDGAEFPDEDQGYDDVVADASSDFDELESGEFELQDNEEVGAFAEEPVDEPVDETEPQTEDVVAEADIYIAYGKYEQAEEMLLKAISNDPGFHEARLKLLETYAAEQDIERFDPHFAKLVAVGSIDLTSRAEHLRETIGGASDFNPNDFDTSEFEQLVESSEFELPETDGTNSDDLGFDMNFDEDSTSVSEEDLTAVPVSGLELDDFEFDLDGLDFEDDEKSELQTETALTESDLELDLGLSDSSETEELKEDDLNDDLDFDLDSLNLEADELPTATVESDDLELDLSSLDESLDDDLSVADLSIDDSLLASLNEEDTEASELSDEIDISLDLDADDLEVDDLELDLDDLELDSLELDSLELDSADIAGQENSEVDELSLELGDDELEELDIDLPKVINDDDLEPDSEDLAVNLDDDLSLDDLDLSALDDELEAMSKDLDMDLGDDLLDSDLDDLELSEGTDDTELDEIDLAEDLELDNIDLDGLDSDDGLTDESDYDLSADLEAMDDLESLDEHEEAESLDDVTSDLDELSVELDEEDDISTAPTETFARLDTSVDFMLPDIDPDSVEDDDLDFLSDSDETATKLDLARAYIDMGDAEGARDIIDEIIKEGSEQHKADAESLLARLDA